MVFFLPLFPLLLPKLADGDPRSAAWHSLYGAHGDIASLWPIDEKDHSPLRMVMRNALRPNSTARWTAYRDARRQFIIPYTIVGHFLPSDERLIMEAMAGVAKNSCVRFRQRRGEPDFLQIRNERGHGCYSTTVGRLSGAGNIINLESNESIQCAGHLGLILHELFHVVGLWHEHQRWDRRRYIRIHRHNALPGTRLQLMRAPRDKVTRYGVPYDYRSVMHYPKDGFALVPGLIVLQTRQPNFQDIIGHAANASPNDYLKVCSIYDCRRCMGRPFRRGHHHGHHRHHFFVQPVSEEEIGRQQRENGQWGGGGEQQLEECRCQWQGCYCRMDHRWQWRPFGPL